MGKNDNRNSWKMRRLKGQAKKKARLARKVAAAKAAGAASAAPAKAAPKKAPAKKKVAEAASE